MVESGDPLTDTELGRDVMARVAAFIEEAGGAQLRVSRTQTGWARRRYFAVLWSARRWLGERGAPLVLTVYLPQRLDSPRFKQVVEVRPGLFAHHLEIRDVAEVDEQVGDWLARAHAGAG